MLSKFLSYIVQLELGNKIMPFVQITPLPLEHNLTVLFDVWQKLLQLNEQELGWPMIQLISLTNLVCPTQLAKPVHLRLEVHLHGSPCLTGLFNLFSMIGLTVSSTRLT